MKLIGVALAAALVAAPAGLQAQERAAVKDGFELAASSGKRILILRPSVSVGAQSTGGMFEPNADWTEQARTNLAASLAKWQSQLGVEEYMALFQAIASSVIEYQFFVGNRLPTKKQDNRNKVFDWSMGPGVASIPGAENADYALFILTKDAYGSTGRKILQLLAAAGPGIAVKSGEHIGYAGLVDLRTGDLLWLNADGQMGGDVRDAEGSEKRMRQLLEEFPGSEIEAD